MEGVSLRPVAPGDEEFLYRLYASTREEELAPVPWTEGQKQAFLRMQFAAQDTDYHRRFPDAAFLVVLREGRPAGRLYVDRRPDELRVIDIALLPEHRGAGIGTALLREILAKADASARPVRIHVERLNPARRLYDRLGFVRVGGDGVYDLMERPPVS